MTPVPALTRAGAQPIDILVVEDSATQAEALRHILEGHGYRATLARDGRQALATLKGYTPALVISDINMPDMNGYELCQHLRAAETTVDLPVILLTSVSDVEDVLEGLACGADSFITKPYSKEYLLAHIGQMVVDERLRARESAGVQVTVTLAGQTREITADPQRMVRLLVSIYAAAIQRNLELLETQHALQALNANLEDLVEARTAVLSTEIIGRDRLQVELRALTLSDELTGLYNRRGFFTLAEQHWRLALRLKQVFVVFYIDVNDFKHINDTFGHTHGDRALAAVARVLDQTFRDSDIVARLGGDEFVVLLTNCDEALANQALVRLQNQLDHTKANGAGLYDLSLSVGQAQFDANQPVGLNGLLEQADADMYARKTQVLKGSGPWSPQLASR
jgi:diguanylate cyclase (GGDEF)-like protein